MNAMFIQSKKIIGQQKYKIDPAALSFHVKHFLWVLIVHYNYWDWIIKPQITRSHLKNKIA